MSAPEGPNDTALRLIQLECIISAKDKEISLLREQLSTDQEDMIQQLQQENEALKEQLQLQQQQKDDADLGQAQGVSNRPRNGGASSGPAEADAVLELLVGGAVLSTSQEAVRHVPGSRLASMLDASSDQQQPRDSRGRIFLPFESAPFAVVLSLLHASSVFGRSSKAYAHLLRQHSPPSHPYLASLIQHLGLEDLLDADQGALDSPYTPSTTNPAAGHPPTAATAGYMNLLGPGTASTAAAQTLSDAADVSSDKAPLHRPAGHTLGTSGSGEPRIGSGSGSNHGGVIGSSAAGGSRIRRTSSPSAYALSNANMGAANAAAGGAAQKGRSQQQLSQAADQRQQAADKTQQQSHRQQQQHADGKQQKDPQAEAKLAAAAAAAQSAALQALTTRPSSSLRNTSGSSGGGGVPEGGGSSGGPALPADQVAAAALKGLLQAPRGGRVSGSTDLKD